MSEEYYVRRQVLLKRIDLTIQSFMWSDQAKVDITNVDTGGCHGFMIMIDVVVFVVVGSTRRSFKEVGLKWRGVLFQANVLC